VEPELTRGTADQALRMDKVIGNKKNLQDSILRSRYTPNDGIGHEFDAMTSPK